MGAQQSGQPTSSRTGLPPGRVFSPLEMTLPIGTCVSGRDPRARNRLDSCEPERRALLACAIARRRPPVAFPLERPRMGCVREVGITPVPRRRRNLIFLPETAVTVSGPLSIRSRPGVRRNAGSQRFSAPGRASSQRAPGISIKPRSGDQSLPGPRIPANPTLRRFEANTQATVANCLHIWICGLTAVARAGTLVGGRHIAPARATEQVAARRRSVRGPDPRIIHRKGGIGCPRKP